MRRRNLGNYEHIESNVEIALVEGDCSDKALEMAKSVLSKALGLEKTSTKVAVKTSTNAKEEAITKEDPKEEKTTKKKAAVKKAVVTKEQVLIALRDYAKANNSKERAQSVLEDVTGADSLANVDKKHYAKLVKALAV